MASGRSRRICSRGRRRAGRGTGPGRSSRRSGAADDQRARTGGDAPSSRPTSDAEPDQRDAPIDLAGRGRARRSSRRGCRRGRAGGGSARGRRPGEPPAEAGDPAPSGLEHALARTARSCSLVSSSGRARRAPGPARASGRRRACRLPAAQRERQQDERDGDEDRRPGAGGPCQTSTLTMRLIQNAPTASQQRAAEQQASPRGSVNSGMT